MSSKPIADYSESDFNLNGDPVELDHLLSSDLPHTDDQSGDDESGEPYARTDLDVDVDGFADLDEDESAVIPSEPAKRGRPRAGTAQPVPATVDAEGQPLSVYQRLVDYELLRKITDIVMAKVAIPWHLRADATQEVHATWATLIAKPEFQRNQLARYAYISGQHAALKLRRTIGAVVAIPGALFRTGRDTAFMEAIGAAVNPKDVDDYRDSIELSTEPMEDLQLSRVSESFFADRMSGLNLSAKQALIARKALVERMAADDIAEELGMDLMYVERLLNQVTQKLLSKDSGDDEAVKPARKSRKPAETKPTKTTRAKASADPALRRGVRRSRKKVSE